MFCHSTLKKISKREDPLDKTIKHNIVDKRAQQQTAN